MKPTDNGSQGKHGELNLPKVIVAMTVTVCEQLNRLFNSVFYSAFS